MVTIKYQRKFVVLGLIIICASIILILFYLRIKKNEEESSLDPELEKLVSLNLSVREAKLEELFKAKKESGDNYDIDHKYELFRKIIQIESANYVFRSVYFLSLLPEDPLILNFTKSHLTDDVNSNILIGSLTYLEKHRPRIFEEYFKSKGYENIKDTYIGKIFASSDTIYKIRQEYYEELINKYIASLSIKPADMTFDQQDLLRKEIINEDGKIVPTIISRYNKSINTTIPLQIIWILGEIGNPEAFDILLEEYLARPTERTGISLGSCLRSLSYKKLFKSTFKNEQELRKLLMFIYGKKWNEVEHLSIEEIESNLFNNLQNIIDSCKNRSVPIHG
jgi:hypothetical protein